MGAGATVNKRQGAGELAVGVRRTVELHPRQRKGEVMAFRKSLGGEGFVCLLGLAAACFGCSGAGGEYEESVGSADDSLYLWNGATRWPGGTVPVCWTSASAARSDFGTRSIQVRTLLENSWPSVANVRFTGWGVCNGSPAN